jgi:hypothetical protein
MTGRWLVCLSLVLCAACQRSDARKLPAKAPFIALERDFQGFRDWVHVDLSTRPAGTQTHGASEAKEFINQLPAPGSKEFPVGTILVKSTHSPTGKEDIFAMVKRGDGYNARGANGWEWFELTRRSDASYGILWRGLNPPDGQGYGGLPSGGCNGCHQGADKNDFVHASKLGLSKI